MAEFQSRQGDIFFKSCKKPDFSKMKKKTDAIFAYGEITSHAHKLTTNISDCESYVDENGDIFIRSDKEMTVGHDEHDTIVLPANQWICVSRQREFDPIASNREKIVRD